MKALFFSVLLASGAAAQQDSITLDPAAMSEVWSQVAGGAAVPGGPVLRLNEAVPAACPEAAALFREARGAVGTPAFPVLLLSLLQQLNPQLPMDKNVWAYAAALELHRQAFTGSSRACAELAAALSCGKLAGLIYFADAVLAAECAAASQAQPGGQVGASE
ncbi:MAG: hypothetical protein IJB00_02515 [Akkermansia sp.]|nr:hypothetical protein [Akkermansia sp.]